MGRIAVLDANALWPQYLRDALLTAAEFDLYRGHWSEEILREMRDSLVRTGRKTPERADWTCNEMRRGFPHFMVSGHAALIPSMTNDEKDRHVLAAAVYAGADTIITFNVKDFPPESRAPYSIDVDTPNDFLRSLWLLDMNRLAHALVRMAGRLWNPPHTVQQLVEDRLRHHAPTFADLAIASGVLEAAVRDDREGKPLSEFHTP